MNRRILKKRVNVFSALALSVPLTLAHARPSLWTLGRGTQRLYVYQTCVRELGVSRSAAHRATWLTFAKARP